MNFTPRLTPEVSPPSIVAGVPKSKIVAAGVTAAESADAVEPTPLTAVTVNV